VAWWRRAEAPDRLPAQSGKFVLQPGQLVAQLPQPEEADPAQYGADEESQRQQYEQIDFRAHDLPRACHPTVAQVLSFTVPPW
jgi:hypothetical protein